MTEKMIPDEKPDIAFVGTGWIGLHRMKVLIDEGLCNPVAILEPDAANARRALELAPAAILIQDMDDLLDSHPDGIVIATPSALHASQCIAALRRGIPVFCQKPLGRSADETREVISEAYVANRLLDVDLSYRYTDGMEKIYQRRKELGHIFAIDLVFNNAYGPDKPWFYNPKLSGGGCLVDLGVHLIDLALWMTDFPEIVSVSSQLASKGRLIEYDNETVEDYVSAQFETADGTLVRLVCSWNLPAGQDAEIRASFYGTGNSALFYNVNGSFFDFEAALCHGTSREIISKPPDAWGGRAIVKWMHDLQEGRHFRSSAFRYYNTAEVIDRIYKKILMIKPAWNEIAVNN